MASSERAAPPGWRPGGCQSLRAVAAGAAPRHAMLMASQTSQGHLDSMDRSGIDAAVLFPTYGSYLVSIDSMDSSLAHAFGRAYNDWLRDFCRAAPKRLIGVGLIARHERRRWWPRRGASRPLAGPRW